MASATSRDGRPATVLALSLLLAPWGSAHAAEKRGAPVLVPTQPKRAPSTSSPPRLVTTPPKRAVVPGLGPASSGATAPTGVGQASTTRAPGTPPDLSGLWKFEGASVRLVREGAGYVGRLAQPTGPGACVSHTDEMMRGALRWGNLDWAGPSDVGWILDGTLLLCNGPAGGDEQRRCPQWWRVQCPLHLLMRGTDSLSGHWHMIVGNDRCDRVDRGLRQVGMYRLGKPAAAAPAPGPAISSLVARASPPAVAAVPTGPTAPEARQDPVPKLQAMLSRIPGIATRLGAFLPRGQVTRAARFLDSRDLDELERFLATLPDPGQKVEAVWDFLVLRLPREETIRLYLADLPPGRGGSPLLASAQALALSALDAPLQMDALSRLEPHVLDEALRLTRRLVEHGDPELARERLTLFLLGSDGHASRGWMIRTGLGVAWDLAPVPPLVDFVKKLYEEPSDAVGGAVTDRVLERIHDSLPKGKTLIELGLELLQAQDRRRAAEIYAATLDALEVADSRGSAAGDTIRDRVQGFEASLGELAKQEEAEEDAIQALRWQLDDPKNRAFPQVRNGLQTEIYVRTKAIAARRAKAMPLILGRDLLMRRLARL